MKARLYVTGRAFLRYICPECGQSLDDKDKVLRHPTSAGTWRKTPSKCSYAGNVYKVPTVELEEVVPFFCQ